MHELAICQSLMSKVTAIARARQALCVTRIVLRVGPLSGAEPDLLRDAFPFAAAGGVAAGARLEIERMPVTVLCDSCAARSEVPPNRLLCAHCGDYHVRVTGGDELLLVSLELERDEQPISQEATAHV